MKLCEHIAGIYRNEIEHGNEPVFVSTPSYVVNGFVNIMEMNDLTYKKASAVQKIADASC